MFKDLRLSSAFRNPKNFFFATNEILIPLAFALSALLLVLDRLKHPILIASDLSVQIEATLNLLNGDGFGNFTLFNDAFKGLHIAIKPLTHFPPGMSLILLLLLKQGLPLVVALKLVYAFATLLGWLLWGILFRNVVFAHPIPCNKPAYWLLYISTVFIGLLFPLLYTLSWNGTDLLLWSLLPCLILLLLSASEKEGRKQNVNFFYAGLLVGFLYFIRYLSIYLAFAFVIYAILQKYQLKKYLYFAAGFLIFYGIIAAYKQSVKTHFLSWWKLSPDSLLDLELLKQKIIVNFSPYTLKVIVQNIASLLIGPVQTWSSLTWLPIVLLLALAVFSLPTAIIFSQSRKSLVSGERSLLFNYYLTASLITGLVLVILIVTFMSKSAFDYNLFNEHRYFYQMFPLLLFMSAQTFNTLSGVFYNSNLIVRFSRPKRIILFSAMNVTGICLLAALSFALNTARTDHHPLISHLKSYIPTYSQSSQHGWNNVIQSRTPESAQILESLLKKNNDIVVVSFAEDFDFGHTINPQVRRRFVLGPGRFRHGIEPFKVWPLPITRDSDNIKSKHFYFIFNIDPKCASYCYHDSGVPVDFSNAVSQFKLVYENDDERIRIFEAFVQ